MSNQRNQKMLKQISSSPNQNGDKNQSKQFWLDGVEIHKKYFHDENVLGSFFNVSKTDTLIQNIESLVQNEATSLSQSQLRNLYDKIIRADNLINLKLIRPHLAYSAARLSGKDPYKAKKFLSLIDYMIRELEENQLAAFKRFMEVIVAYHKYYSKVK